MGNSVKLMCPTRAWAYLHFVNLPTFRYIRTIMIFAVESLFKVLHQLLPHNPLESINRGNSFVW